MRIFFGHDEPAAGEGSRFVAMQRAASAAGLAYLDAGSHLCLHPKFGPWFALRATLVFDAVEYTGARCVVACMPMLWKLQAYQCCLLEQACSKTMTCELPASSEQNLPQAQHPHSAALRQLDSCDGSPLPFSLQHRQLWGS